MSVAGIVIYKVNQDGSLEGRWTHRDLKGHFATELASGGTPGSLTGEYKVDIRLPDNQKVFAGSLTISFLGEAYSLIWNGMALLPEEKQAHFSGVGTLECSDILVATFQGDDIPTHSAESKMYYPTYGVHNPPSCSPCACPDCLYERSPGEPSDPLFPLYWSAKWTMYRVFKGYKEFPPPYDGPPPAGCECEVSYGATYYDSTWIGPNGEQGAMMEHYEDRSLPIFPISNHFTSSFISLGDNAYFLTYGKDRPKGMPPICLFSNLNHPPRRDFIKHLPYSKGDSDRLGQRIQGYSFWTSMQEHEPPIQTGASPDLTGSGILFGYAFKSDWEPDSYEKNAAPYRHPHSFYFSGAPTSPPDAPIVSQFYTEFAMIRPDPALTWDLVAKFANGKPVPACHLYDAGHDANSATCDKHAWAGKIRARRD